MNHKKNIIMIIFFYLLLDENVGLNLMVRYLPAKQGVASFSRVRVQVSNPTPIL